MTPWKRLVGERGPSNAVVALSSRVACKLISFMNR